MVPGVVRVQVERLPEQLFDLLGRDRVGQVRLRRLPEQVGQDRELIQHGRILGKRGGDGLRPLQEAADQLDGPTAAAAAREMARLDARVPSVAETLANEKEATTVDLLEMLRQPDVRRQLLAPYGDSLPRFFVLRLSFTPKRQMLDNIRSYMDAMIARSRVLSASSTPAGTC